MESLAKSQLGGMYSGVHFSCYYLWQILDYMWRSKGGPLCRVFACTVECRNG